MGRKRVGPVRPHGPGGCWYAHLIVGGKHYRQSLKTKDHGVALERYGAAMQQLKQRAKGIKPVAIPPAPTAEATVWDPQPDGSFKERRTTAAELYEPEQFQLTWEQATQIHAQRQEERRGKPLAASTLAAFKQAYSDLSAIPADVTTNDIRLYVKQLKDRGYSATTIAQRCSLLQAVTQTLVKQDLLKENVWTRVDTAATSSAHYHEATKEELKAVIAGGDPALLALVYTGMRVGELASREPRHLEGGRVSSTGLNTAQIPSDANDSGDSAAGFNRAQRWISIEATKDWRPKTKDSIRRLPIPEWLDLQLPTVGTSAINRRLKKYSPALSAHSLRHAYATAIREAGIPFDLGQHLLGHANPGGTIASTYGSFTPEAVLRATQEVWRGIQQATGHSPGSQGG